jgi:hypothetical protein
MQNFFISLGYHHQKKEHKLSVGRNAIYIKEQNYYDNGVLVEISYHHSKDVLLTGIVTYSKRIHPESENVDIIRFYKSQNILNLFILFQAPIKQNLGVNVFLSYDVDEELDNDKNDTRSIIFSTE